MFDDIRRSWFINTFAVVPKEIVILLDRSHAMFESTLSNESHHHDFIPYFKQALNAIGGLLKSLSQRDKVSRS